MASCIHRRGVDIALILITFLAHAVVIAIDLCATFVTFADAYILKNMSDWRKYTSDECVIAMIRHRHNPLHTSIGHSERIDCRTNTCGI